ncbi:hypothetical protein SCAR479_12812 [Seiridium cardinale]|uniref:Uncharacterized protein n=1 Tax=Seiridium cardinale TaxID=138064 RepID=A0ABR2X9Y3_9PEZI
MSDHEQSARHRHATASASKKRSAADREQPRTNEANMRSWPASRGGVYWEFSAPNRRSGRRYDPWAATQKKREPKCNESRWR